MQQSNTTPFDDIATAYDDFSSSFVGRHQRQIIRNQLQQFLRDKQGLRILEINCGTGDDALWLASLGHNVIATDKSATMIAVAEEKLLFYTDNNKPTFAVSDFNQLDKLVAGKQFDLVFSNFSGLNCIPPIQLSQLGSRLHSSLKKDGNIVIIIFGKYCWWELAYFFWKANVKKAFRRWHSKEALAKLSADIYQPVYYYSVQNIIEILGHFELLKKRPVGLFIPPSYLEKMLQKNQRFSRLLLTLEKQVGKISALSEFADHVYILLKKSEK